MTDPVVELRWNAAGWWGGLVAGGVGWIVLVAGEILLRTRQGWASLLALLVAATLLAIGSLLWRLRATVAPAAGGLLFLLGCFPAAVGVFALRELAGLADFPVRRLWPLLLLGIGLPACVLLAQRRTRAA
jgi:hypothetical protein